MTISKAQDFHNFVYGIVSGTLGIPVFSGQPALPPPRWARLDGFGILADERYKNQERGTHSVMVHVFDDPTRSKIWVTEQLAAAHAALQGALLDEKSRQLRMVASVINIEPSAEEAKTLAHGWIRYNANIGD